jgi:hypothetical protein
LWGDHSDLDLCFSPRVSFGSSDIKFSINSNSLGEVGQRDLGDTDEVIDALASALATSGDTSEGRLIVDEDDVELLRVQEINSTLIQGHRVRLRIVVHWVLAPRGQRELLLIGVELISEVWCDLGDVRSLRLEIAALQN